MTETPSSQEQHSWATFFCIALILLTVAALGRICGNNFVNYDDDVYVTANPYVRSGLSWENLSWAITATDALNWHPVTWMSLQLDAQLYGIKAWGYHLTNLVLHIANTLLLFIALWNMTGAMGCSALLAALFGVHPLHVESVAWIAERKDVLSGLFWMLGLLAYTRYVRRPAVWTYLPMAAALALGLMAKPMLVTFPFVLLLLDYWPLRRLRFGRTAATGAAEPDSEHAGAAPASVRLILLEKVPLLALIAVSIYLTLYAQKRGGAILEFPFSVRLANALVSYVCYLGLTFWPVGLAPFYPYPQDGLPAWQVIGAGIVLVGLSALALILARRHPYVLVGWLWYLGTLVPVIGLVQVGEQSLADRYTYVPLIGLFLIVAWGAANLAARLPVWRWVLLPAAFAIVLACALVAWRQAGLWHDSRSLWEHALQVTPDNHVARINLGTALLESGNLAQAERHLRAALQLKSGYELPYINLAITLDKQGKLDEAIRCYTRALESYPDLYDLRANYGVALCKQGRVEDGIEQFQESIRLNPDYADAYYHLAFALGRKQKFEEALPYGRECVRLQPYTPRYRFTLAQLLWKAGAQQEAREQYRLAQQLNGGGPMSAPAIGPASPRP